MKALKWTIRTIDNIIVHLCAYSFALICWPSIAIQRLLEWAWEEENG